MKKSKMRVVDGYGFVTHGLIKRSGLKAAADMIIRADAEQDMGKKKPRRDKMFGEVEVVWNSYGTKSGMLGINTAEWLYTVKEAERVIRDLQRAVEYIKERS